MSDINVNFLTARLNQMNFILKNYPIVPCEWVENRSVHRWSVQAIYVRFTFHLILTDNVWISLWPNHHLLYDTVKCIKIYYLNQI